jgi:cytochrome c-type biogenesis protein CcmE
VVALSVAVLLAVALIYTSFSASTEAKEPSELLGAAPGGSYEMTGKVVKGSVRHVGNGIAFRVVDRDGEGKALPVTYRGTVPDPFRGGREIVLTGSVENGTFVGEPETLITKCPSKFTTKSDG